MSSLFLEPVCKICGAENVPDNHFYFSHKIPKEKYYKKYYQKKDLFDGSEIKFISAEQYMLSDFSNKVNMRKYLERLDKKDSKDYCINLLKKRKEIKNLKYTPSCAELKTILAPPQQFLDKLFHDDGGYYKTCEKLGFINKFVDFTLSPSGETTQNNEKNFIWCDTREQSVVKLDNIQIKKLDVGDYTLSDSEKCGNVFIERKSLADLIGSLSKNNFDRFNREIRRAEEQNVYLIIMVEESIRNFLSFKYLPHISKKIKASDEYIKHQLRLLLQSFANLQIVFCNGRKEMSRLIPKILYNGKNWKNYDLELLYEKQLI